MKRAKIQAVPAVLRRCALTRPVCVEGNDRAELGTALRLLTDAYETTVLGNLGPAWSLDPLAEPMLWRLGAGPLTFEVTLAPSLGFDRGRGACAGGELTRSTAIACAASSSLALVAPTTAPALRAGAADYLAHLYDGGQDVLEKARRSALAPERGLLSDGVLSNAAPLLDRVAARASSTAQTATAPWLAFVLAATKTPLGASVPQAEPDFFDVLRSTLGKKDPHLAELLDELGVLRFEGGGPLLGTAKPELAWDIDGATLPRNLVLPRPLLPTGSTYVVVRLDAATARSGLALRTFCEVGSRYVWSMARLDEHDRIQSRVQVPQRESSPNAEGVLRELTGAHKALIVGTSLGGGLGATLDPDELPLPHHSCQVALDRLPDP